MINNQEETNRRLKVAHFSFSDTYGAMGAAYELHKGMMQKGINSKFYVRGKTRFDDSIIELGYYDSTEERLLRVIDKLYFDSNKKEPGTAPIHFDCLGLHWDKQLENELKEYDIIHIHWVAGFLNIDNIYQLSKLNKPIVWTMHDFHPFTGGCHYPESCREYENECSSCCELKENSTDITKHILLEKQLKYPCNIHVVVASAWLKDIVQHSKVFRNNPCEVIPIGIDTKCFVPKNKVDMKHKLGLSADVKVILIGAQALAQKIKGYHNINKTIKIIKANSYCNDLIKKGKLCLLAFGSNDNMEYHDKDIPIINVGFIKDREKLCEVYNAADVFVFPSVQDTFGMTAVEAMSCGTPTVAFDVSAMRDVIISGINGYKAEVNDIKSMADHIIHILQKTPINAEECRRRVETYYSLDCEIDKMVQFYHRIAIRQQAVNDSENLPTNNKNIDGFIYKCAFEILTDTAKNRCSGMGINDILLEYNPKFVSPEQKVRRLIKNGRINKEMSVLIYGAGNWGRRTLRELERQNIGVECFWDMDEMKEGQLFEGYYIKKPVKRGLYENKIIIAGIDYLNMKNYLVALGYLYDQDFF